MFEEMFREMERMQREMNQIFDRMSKNMPSADFKDTTVDVFTDKDSVIIKADMPGVNKDQINLVVTENSISIKADRKDVIEEKKEGYYRHERSYKGYNIYRSFPFKVLPKTADAEYKDGILTVRIEKAEKEKEEAKQKVKVK